MTFVQLSYLTSVCENGSTFAAAESLHVSQSTISLSLKKLEEELTAPLFTRTSRGLIPTEAGLLLKKHADCILFHVQQAEQEISDLTSSNLKLTVGLSSMAGSTLWPHLYAFAQQSHITGRLETLNRNRSTCFSLLDHGKIDCFITTLNDPEHQANGYRILKIVQTPPLMFCISKKNPLAGNPSVTCRELYSLPLVELKGSNRTHINQLMETYHCTPNFIQSCEQVSTMIGLIKANIAGGFLNADLLEGYTGIQAYEVKDLEPVDYYLVYTDMTSKRKNFRPFLKIVKQFSQSENARLSS